MASDPGEQRDRMGEHPQVARDLRLKLEERIPFQSVAEISEPDE